MAYIAFISDQFLKDNSWVNFNVDPQTMRPVIRDVQEMQILPLLGTALYNKVMGLISGSPTITLSGSYGTLLHDYIQPAMVWFCGAESTIPVSLQITNKGVVQKNSDNSNPADLNSILSLKDHCLNKAEWRAERLRLFLVNDAGTLYPEYLQPGTGINTIIPKRSGFSSVLSLNNYRTKSSMNTNGSQIPVSQDLKTFNPDNC